MATISQKIPNLIGGVSEQADAFKLAGQLRACTNYFPDPAFGLIKRPGLQAIGKLSGAAADGTWFMAVRDDQERYIMQFSKAGVLKIWDADTGIAKTVNTPAGSATTYATHTSSNDLDILQINDYYFVLNRKVKTAMAAATSPAAVNFAYVVVNAVGTDMVYRIVLNGTAYSYTPNSTHNGVRTILTQLESLIDAGPFNATVIGNCLYIEKDDGADFDIEAVGGNTGTALTAYKGEVPSVTALPQQFKNDAVIKVTGDKTINGDDYYVKFVTENGASFGVGHWKETIAPNTKLRFDGTTMPHIIIREANGTFTFRNLDQTSVTQTTTLTGVPTAITITNNTKGTYRVGESFPVYGGTGKDLRLEVTSTYTRTVITTSTSASTVSYVLYTPPVPETDYQNYEPAKYEWYYNGSLIAITETQSAVKVGNLTYEISGSPLSLPQDKKKWGLKRTQSFPNTINGVKIARAGSGYTANDVVSSDKGTTFTITTVGTATGVVDDPANKYWLDRVVGDEDTNPEPSFIGHTISGINFFKNRLIFLSNENVICSQAGSYFDFFASTVITIVDSDPIDLSCGSRRPVQLTYGLQVPRGLMLFADNAQYVLETSTESFSPSTAEINLVSAFSMDPKVEPTDAGQSFMMLDQTNRAASVRELLVTADSSVKPQSAEITRTVPAYLPAKVFQFKSSSTSNTLALVSEQEPNAIYMYRWLNSDGRALMNSWFKWTLPGDVKLVYFDNENLYLVTNQPDAFLSKVNLVTETSSGPLFFDGQYVDTRLDLYDYNPTTVYLSGTDETKVCFKEGIESFTGTPTVVSLDPERPGLVRNLAIQYDAGAPAGQKYFVLIDGNQTSTPWALGINYEAEATLPALYYKPTENASDTINIPTIYRISVSSYNSGPYSVKISAEGREDFTLELPQITANYSVLDNLPMLRNPTNTIPVMAKADKVEITLKADYPFPTALTSLTWQGSVTTKGVTTR
jgi:hypothetical protein